MGHHAIVNVQYVDSVENYVSNQDASSLCHLWTPQHHRSHHSTAHTAQHPHSS